MRRKVNNRNIVKPDRKYNSTDIAKFINYIMWNGKKSAATEIVYNALEKAEKEIGQSPLDVFKKVLENVSPLIEVRAKRVGGANYQVPMEVRPERRVQLGLRWLIEAARGKKGKSIINKLAEELILAYKNDGSAVKKKEEVHRMAEANKAFAHFANR